MTRCVGIVEDLEVCALGFRSHKIKTWLESGKELIDILGSHDNTDMGAHAVEGAGALPLGGHD